jgi:hypothetical protein
MIKKKYIFVFIPIMFIALVAVYYKLLPFHIKYYNKINIGTKIIKELNDYYIINKKYPDKNDFAIIENIYRKSFLKGNSKFDESIQPYYYNKGNEYILVYIFNFDGPELLYYSKIKKWQYGIGNLSGILYGSAE